MIAFCLCCILTHVAISAPISPKPASVQGGTIVEGLQLTLMTQTSKDTFAAGEPIDMTAALKNTTDKTLQYPSISPILDYQITVKDSRGKPVPLTRYGNSIKTSSSISIGSIDLYKGSEDKYTFLLSRIYDLTEVGEYSVSVQRNVFKQNTTDYVPIVSNTIQIKVVEPCPGGQMTTIPSEQGK